MTPSNQKLLSLHLWLNLQAQSADADLPECQDATMSESLLDSLLSQGLLNFAIVLDFAFAYTFAPAFAFVCALVFAFAFAFTFAFAFAFVFSMLLLPMLSHLLSPLFSHVLSRLLWSFAFASGFVSYLMHGLLPLYPFKFASVSFALAEIAPCWCKCAQPIRSNGTH